MQIDEVVLEGVFLAMGSYYDYAIYRGYRIDKRLFREGEGGVDVGGGSLVRNRNYRIYKKAFAGNIVNPWWSLVAVNMICVVGPVYFFIKNFY